MTSIYVYKRLRVIKEINLHRPFKIILVKVREYQVHQNPLGKSYWSALRNVCINVFPLRKAMRF